MPHQLLPPSFLFRLAVPCRQAAKLWTPKGVTLEDEYLLPNFAELDDAPQRVQVRAAWSEQGLAFSVAVQGKKQPPWCRESRIDDSDGVYLWIDTRDTHNIHRASRFCHQFVFLPTGGGYQQAQPIAELIAINRSRENPKPLVRDSLGAVCHKLNDGYRLDIAIPAAALTGFDPAEHPKLGFHWAVIDREIGEHTFCCPPTLPYKEDPSTWGTLELVTNQCD
ncbi:MAG TPA: hypothetical protein VMJ32_01660 [Pirellulales bacterium]|nr:hypothetical protein [Pirellulales bacterium]